MRIAILDCFAGISGDMTLGALIDAGVPKEHIVSEIRKLGLSGFKIQVEETERHHINAKKIHVIFNEEDQPERKYQAIKNMIQGSGLSGTVKSKALKAFKILGEAESKIHNKDINEIHFHEIGAVDSIIDLIGSIIGFDYLGIEEIYGNPVPLGTGFTNTEHGTMPVPSPAALEILKGYPVMHKKSDFEMTTPTGAVLLKLLVDQMVSEQLNYKPINIAYGAGSKESKKWPNLLRLIIAEKQKIGTRKSLSIIETNIDDLNPEIYPFVMDQILKAGANDVFLSNIIMKKGRPGVKISVIVNENLIPEVEQILFSQTTTIGIRKYAIDRSELPRKNKTIVTQFGPIKVKVIDLNGKEILRPEYEECKKLAEEKGINILKIYRIIESMNNN